MTSFYVDNEKKVMYLKNLKINYKTKTYNRYLIGLNKLDSFEKEKNLSASNMNKYDFIEFLSSYNSSSLNSLYSYKSEISSYLKFIKSNNQFEVDEINQYDLTECINFNAESFITEKEYHDILENKKGNWQDKLAVVLLWNKIKGKNNFNNLLNIKISDVDLYNKTINDNGKITHLQEFEIEIVKKAINEQVYIRTTKEKNEISEVKVDFLTGDYLVKATVGTTNKMVETNQCTYGTFKNRMNKYFNLVLKKTGLTNARVFKSSVFYYMLRDFGRKLTTSEMEEYAANKNIEFTPSNCYRIQDIMYEKMEKENLFVSKEEYLDINDFSDKNEFIEVLSNIWIDDTPPQPYSGKPKDKKDIYYSNNKKTIIPRSTRISINALKLANYSCEVDNSHCTFTRRKDGKPYTEPHHLIPLSKYDEFDYDIDIEENIISLCSNCHNKIHYGSDIESMLQMLFEKRKDLLEKCNIKINFEELLDCYK